MHCSPGGRNCSWEKRNRHEKDGTPDQFDKGSRRTSIQTDGKPGTSPSGVFRSRYSQRSNTPSSVSHCGFTPKNEINISRKHFNVNQGYERFCVQQKMAPYYNPVTRTTYNVLMCYNCEADGIDCEWEFANNHEWDGTNDGSYWTSIETDNILATSPSLNGI